MDLGATSTFPTTAATERVPREAHASRCVRMLDRSLEVLLSGFERVSGESPATKTIAHRFAEVFNAISLNTEE